MRYLKTNDVIIRRFRKEDINRLQDIYDNVDYINNKLETYKLIESAIYEYYTEEPVWALEEKNTQKLFGYIKIENYSPKNKICYISWSVKDEYANSVLIKQALKKVINFLFKEKNVDLIECSYYGQNKQKDIILGNIGMKKEAVLKQRRYNEQTHKKEDFFIYSIDIKEFNQLEFCTA
jgi:ribosomal-protein-alanine N-acetyltransferase